MADEIDINELKDYFSDGRRNQSSASLYRDMIKALTGARREEYEAAEKIARENFEAQNEILNKLNNSLKKGSKKIQKQIENANKLMEGYAKEIEENAAKITQMDVALKKIETIGTDKLKKIKAERLGLSAVIAQNKKDIETMSETLDRLDYDIDILKKAKEGSSDKDVIERASLLSGQGITSAWLENNRKDTMEKINKKEEDNIKLMKKKYELEKSSYGIFEKRYNLIERSKRFNQAKKDAERTRDEKLLLAGNDDPSLISQINKDFDTELTNAAVSNGFSSAAAASKASGWLLAAEIIVGALEKVTNAIVKQMDKGVEDAMTLQTANISQVNSRLQGMQKDLTTMGFKEGQYWQYYSKVITDGVQSSTMISSRKVLEKLSALASEGISFNVEERAILATLSENIVSTFNALDDSLKRLVKLNQRDVTQSRLGMEAQLLQLLNSAFSDSSYLNSLYDSVAGILIDATSQFKYDTATEFEYAVQKWLGALYALGLSDSAVTTLAQGVTYLTTGNVNALGGNQGLQTLMAISAQNAGLSYSDILTRGLNASSVDALFNSIIEYLQTIAYNTDNQVTKSAWGNILGLSLSDLRAIQNFTSNDISTLLKSTTSYADTRKEVSSQISLLTNRLSEEERVNNWISNTLLNYGMGLINSSSELGKGGKPVSNYLLYRGADVLGDSLSNIVGGGFVGSVVKLFKNLFKISLDTDDLFDSFKNAKYAFEEFTNLETASSHLLDLLSVYLDNEAYLSRGTGFEGITGLDAGTRVVSGISMSKASRNITNTLVQNAIQAANMATAVTSYSGTTDVYDTNDIYEELFINQNKPIKVRLVEIDENARNTISEANHVNMLDTIATYVTDTGVEVHLDDSGDFNTIRDAIYTAKNLR